MSKVITKIEAQKKKDNRVNIFINEEFAFGCSSELIYYHNLFKGKEINLEELEKVIKEDNYITGKTKALKYLETSIRSEHQIREYLEKREYDEESIDRVIKFLIEYKFIDDEYYSRAFVTQNIKNQGKNNIKYKLLKRGICEEVIVKTLDEIPSEDEEDIAFNLGEKKARVICKNESDIRKIKNKLNSFLMSKGYSYDTIKSVIEKLEIVPTIKEEKEIVIPLNEGGIEEMSYMRTAVFQESQDEENHKEELFIIAEKRFDKLSRTEANKMKLKRKLQDFLLRKGYNYSEIKSVMNKLINGVEEEY